MGGRSHAVSKCWEPGLKPWSSLEVQDHPCEDTLHPQREVNEANNVILRSTVRVEVATHRP